MNEAMTWEELMELLNEIRDGMIIIIDFGEGDEPC